MMLIIPYSVNKQKYQHLQLNPFQQNLKKSHDKDNLKE